MTPEQIATVITAAGVPLIIRELIAGWRASRSGRAAAEKTRNRTAIEEAARAEARMDAAEARADAEASRRRLWEDYAGELRWLLLQCGMPAHKVTAWPDRDQDHDR